jgi:2,2-dialkylglycine decarboxylase (pyruvate)
MRSLNAIRIDAQNRTAIVDILVQHWSEYVRIDVQIDSEETLLAAAEQYLLVSRMDKSRFTGPVFVTGEGSIVRDVTGRDYLDFNSGQMCSALGHRNPRIVAAIKDAADTLIHASSMFFNVEEVRLGEKLARILPSPLKRSLFLDSGAAANETALGMAKAYTGGYEVASPHVAFHGLSDASRGLTFAGWRKGYGPYTAGIYAILAPYRYRCPVGLSGGECCNMSCLDASFELLDAQTDGQLAAVMTEPLFSAGGVIDPPPGWLARLAEKTRERGALLILDEAQTGLGKLGTVWACEQEGVTPDILTTSKHFGGGVAVSAACTTDEIADRVQTKGFITGHSHQNDPMSCAAGSASIDEIVSENLPAKALEIGSYWRAKLDELASRHELIGDIRGRGLLQGIELVWHRETKEPAYAAGRHVEQHCVDSGLLFSARRGGSVLRFVPPWTTTTEQMDEAAGILDDALTSAASATAADVRPTA